MRTLLAALCLILAAGSGAAQENGDLGLIPEAIDSEPAGPSPPASNAHGKYFLENDSTLASTRGNLTAAMPPPSPWLNRTSLDAYDQWSVDGTLFFTFSDRLNLSETNGTGAPAETSRNDVREVYGTWEPASETYVEFGRINLKNGVALGFNPTDFFKTRSAVAQASADPASLRDDRLGTLMLRAETIWDGGSATIAFAPRLQPPRPLDRTAPGWLNPSFDQTNGADRFLVALNPEIGDFGPQALIYHEGERTRFGLNLSHPLGQAIVAYAEWAGGNAPDLIANAISVGKATGTLPSTLPVLPSTSTGRALQNDLAVGASWSSAARITLNLEFHVHQAGFSSADWRNWFAVGAADPAAATELWYVRGYASDQQEPMSRQQVFLRADWQDAFIKDLELSAIAFVNPVDGSAMMQAAASRYLSGAWTVAGYFGGTFGGRRSEWGSIPGAVNATIQVVRYF
jgi:hypothetical protein